MKKKKSRSCPRKKIVIDEDSLGRIGTYFSVLEDPRIERTKKHLLLDIIGVTLIAIISGCNSWVEVEEFGKLREEWLRKHFSLAHGIPSHDTIGRLFALLDSRTFQACFIEWMKDTIKTPRDVIAIDGKSICGSASKAHGKKAIHMVSAFSCAHGLVLGQEKCAEKSNEITAIPALLKQLDLRGTIVTIDAMGCQKEIAKAIVDKKSDFVFGLKGNQGKLHGNVKSIFRALHAEGYKHAQAVSFEADEKNHGRHENRKYTVIDYRPPEADLCMLFGREPWTGISSIAMVESTRTIGKKKTTETRYYISSLRNKGDQFVAAIRKHWSIENSLHWMLDVTFREDHSQVRTKNAAENFSIIRRTALNLLKMEKTYKASMNCKRLRASIDTDYLEKVLFR